MANLVFDATIPENTAFRSPEASQLEIEQATRAADAHEFIMALSDDYSTSIGQRGRLISRGQRQRIAIARAMIRNAPELHP